MGVSVGCIIALLHHKDSGKILRKVSDFIVAGMVCMLGVGEGLIFFLHPLILLRVIEISG